MGDPLPPALYIPMPVTELHASQMGDEVVLRFTLPARSTEDLALDEPLAIDLRGAVWENRDWDESVWEREAIRIPAASTSGPLAEVRFPIGTWVGKRVLFRVRAAGKTGRLSAWSSPVALSVLPAQVPPGDVRAEPDPDGVRVSWKLPPGAHPDSRVQVFRSANMGDDGAQAGEARESPWLDTSAQFGERYVYRLRTAIEGDERNAISDFSRSVEIQPVDTFAPEAPTGLVASPGAGSIELSWAQNRERDFDSYRVYRSVAGGEFLRLGDATSIPTFSDSTAPANQPLRYRVTALDKAGNESAPSNAAEISLP